MNTKQGTTSDLKYANEHLICENYLSEEQAIWNVIDLEAGGYFIKEWMEHSTLVFLLSGKMKISTASAVGQEIGGRQMLLVSGGDNFYGKAITDSCVLCCSFNRNMSLCNRFSIGKLQKYVTPDMQQRKRETTLLPVHGLLLQELEATRSAISSGLSCIHYQHIKRDLIFILLRGFYNKEQLAALFAPILGEDHNFKEKVMQVYSQIETAQELMGKFNMSPTVFKRKFRQSFGNSARQWLIQKKKEKLFRDIVMTDITIAELADKYSFTVNYMSTFCREHFGKSPTQLRSEWNNHSKE